MESPPTRPVNGSRECSMLVKSSTERRAMFSRTVAVDVDDNDSQTSSSCPTSSSSTSTNPPGHITPNVHQKITTQREHTTIGLPPQVIAAASGTTSQFQVAVRPVTVTCRVRPLNNVDWRGDGQRQAGMSTTSPAAASGLRDGSGDGEQNIATIGTPLMSRRCVGPPSNIVPRRNDDDCEISVDDILTSDHVVETENLIYDNVQQLHVHV